MVFLYVIIVLICILLMGVILVQNSKGGGLASNFQSSNQVMGVRKTADFLEKATWGLAIGLMLMCLAASFAQGTTGTAAEESAIKDRVEETAPLAPPPVQSEAPPTE